MPSLKLMNILIHSLEILSIPTALLFLSLFPINKISCLEMSLFKQFSISYLSLDVGCVKGVSSFFLMSNSLSRVSLKAKDLKKLIQSSFGISFEWSISGTSLVIDLIIFHFSLVLLNPGCVVFEVSSLFVI